MATYREMHEVGKDPVRVNRIAEELLLTHKDELDEWRLRFLKDMAAWKGAAGEALSTRQAETLFELRDGLKKYSKVGGMKVSKLIEECWMGRLDLEEDDKAFIERVRGSFDLRRGEVRWLLHCARQLNLIEGYIDIGA
jgi:hypothetical protein